MDKRPAWNPSINDSFFRGVLEIRYYQNQLILINELDLEDYVKGIGEVMNSDPLGWALLKAAGMVGKRI